MLIPSAHPLPSVLRAKKIDAKFSSNEKQAFSAATVIFRGWWWWWKVKINQPNHPNTHPPLADQQQQHHMKLLSQLHCLRRPQRRLQLRRRVDRSSDQSTHQHQNETCAPACLSVSMCVCVNVSSAGSTYACACVCVCVLNFNFSLLFLVRRSRCRRRRRRSLRSCSFIRSVRSFGLLGSPSVCTVRWFSWNFAFDLVGCVSCIALCEQRKNTENCKEVVEAKKATKCKRSAEHRKKKTEAASKTFLYTKKIFNLFPLNK